MYESFGGRSVVDLFTAFDVKSASLCNILEEDLNKLEQKQVLPQQPLILKITKQQKLCKISPLFFTPFKVLTIKLVFN